jgi:enterochelin esterase-like enzyme
MKTTARFPIVLPLTVICLITVASLTAPAQSTATVTNTAGVQRPVASPGDRLKSPEILPDRQVMFRIYAPKADEVTVRGDWMDASSGQKLVRDDQGIWSITVGPLTPDYYCYAFSVDGVRTADPKNGRIKLGINSVDSLFFLAGPEADFEDNQPVLHGDIRAVWYQSANLSQQRRMHIYTPPGYDNSRSRYPVLYLLHGGGDEDSGWSTIGRAGFILDNLIAEQKARPMLIVMPNGSLPPSTNLPAITPGTTPSPEAAAALAAAQSRFTTELMKEIIPFVERNYRVRPYRESRAIAGLSMGGAQTQRIITNYPDKFGYVAIWSAGVSLQNTADFESRTASFLDRPEKVNQWIKLMTINVGSADFTCAGCRNLSEILTRHGIKHELHISDGGHTWINWRHYLGELAPRLFL